MANQSPEVLDIVLYWLFGNQLILGLQHFGRNVWDGPLDHKKLHFLQRGQQEPIIGKTLFVQARGLWLILAADAAWGMHVATDHVTYENASLAQDP